MGGIDRLTDGRICSRVEILLLAGSGGLSGVVVHGSVGSLSVEELVAADTLAAAALEAGEIEIWKPIITVLSALDAGLVCHSVRELVGKADRQVWRRCVSVENGESS